jgi:hypothetical protein
MINFTRIYRGYVATIPTLRHFSEVIGQTDDQLNLTKQNGKFRTGILPAQLKF